MQVGRLILVSGTAVAVVLAFHFPASATEEPDALMPGTVTVVKGGKAPLAKFTAKPLKGATFDLPAQANDPTVHGATLHIFDTGDPGAGDDTYALPFGGWKGLGVPAGAKGFKYKGLGTPEDPCKAVLVKPTVVKAVCKGSGVTLTPPLTADLGIVLTVGTDSKRYCATFGGTPIQNLDGKLVRKAAPAPEVCAAITTTSTTSTTTTTTTTTTTHAFIFRTVVASAVCGHVRDGDNNVIRDLDCGTLSLGSGLSSTPPSVTPDGAGNRFAGIATAALDSPAARHRVRRQDSVRARRRGEAITDMGRAQIAGVSVS